MDQRDNGESHSESFDDVLDGGLHVAFARSSRPGAANLSILASLEETMGIHPRVLLRDVEGDLAPVSLPKRDEVAAHLAVGRYQVAGELARGGVGVVLKGRDPDLGRDVAIKLLRSEHADRSGLTARFVEEAQIAAQLQHPGIPPVYELGLGESHRPFFSMKLIKGRTLAVLLADRSETDQDLERFLGIFEQVCQSVAYAHARGVVHRDLKPSNVMVGAFGEVQVVDWGLAKVLSSGGLADEGDGDTSAIATVRTADARTHSEIGAIVGTPAYMSPEQANGEVKRLNERTDVFALGAILCEILTHRPPFHSDRQAALRQAQAGDLSEAIQRIDACGADGQLKNLARTCLSSSPSDRPRDARRVAEAVSAYLQSLIERARASELAAARADATAKGERRARRLTTALATVILAAAVLIGGGIFWLQSQQRQRESAQSAALNEMVDSAAIALSEAVAAPIGQSEPWVEVRLVADQIETRLSEAGANEPTGQRARRFLEKLAGIERDRNLVETIEEIVIMGATHNDARSWTWMEESLRQSFLEYGIDLTELTPSEVAERIRASDLAVHLADALELWIGTCGHLLSFGVTIHPPAELKKWVEALYEADEDRFATEVRRMVYSQAPTVEDVKSLMGSVAFDKVRPRTLSWLASATFRTGDMDLVRDIFQRAVQLYPDDFMLNFDYAFSMIHAGDYDLAIRSYERCLAIRPHSAGVWRSLGTALREVEQYEGSEGAIRRSIELQPDHAPSHADLGATLEAAGRVEEAIAAYEQALAIDSDSASAQTALRRLQESSDAPRSE